MCSSRKNPYPPQGGSSEIPTGRGVLKAKILEAKYEAKLEFLGGGGCKTKNLLWGEYVFTVNDATNPGWKLIFKYSLFTKKRHCLKPDN